MPEHATEAPDITVGEEDDFLRFAAEAHLLDVRTTKLVAELHSEASSDDLDLDLGIFASFRRTDEGFECKFDFTSPLRSGEEKVADFEVSIVVVFRMENVVMYDDKMMKRFIERVGFVVAVPFAREVLQSTAVRLGLPAVTLGLFRNASATPFTATIRGSASR